MTTTLQLLTTVAAVSSGVVAGIFFAFSNFIMKALARIDMPAGIAAMQSINVVVLNPGFLSLFVGNAALTLFLGVVGVLHWNESASLWLLGGVCYVLGCFGVTMVFNVPRNEVLAKQIAGTAEADAVWRKYIGGWTRWNHVRTIASLAAAFALVFAID